MQLAAQTSTSSPSYPLPAVVVTGSVRFRSDDLAKATGLKIGSTVTADDLKTAGDRLSQTGLFSQVGYRFDGKVATYTVVDSDAMVPIVFENFVWFSDAELGKKIQAAVPLFVGVVPASGTVTDQVSAALDQLLKEKGIQGHAVAEPVVSGDKASAIRVRAGGINVKIAQIDFTGAASDLVPQLQAAAKGLLGASYMQSAAPSEIWNRVSPIYGRLGFLKAKMGVPQLSILKDDPIAPAIALQVPLDEGPQYTFEALDWSGNKALANEDLDKTVGLKVGAPADTSQLSRVIGLAKGLYSTRGYLHTEIKATATVDSLKHTALVHLAVDEGPVYHMGTLELTNISANQADLVQRVWSMKPGDVYDATYIKGFLVKHAKELPFLIGWNAQYTQTIHDDTQVVDLKLKFVKQ